MVGPAPGDASPPGEDDAERGAEMSRDPIASDVGAFIRSQREVARMSVRKLAEVAGVSNPYLSQIERGIRRPSAEILRQLADALRINVEALYVRAGLLRDDDGERPGVVEAIERDPVLTPDQKVALINVYESFVGRPADDGPLPSTSRATSRGAGPRGAGESRPAG